jgi:tripartite-type tricarboxylate transporter receptor subunit TctC
MTRHPIKRRLALAGLTALAGLALVLPLAAAAQPAWPTKPVSIVVPFSAGGSTDVVARLVGQKLSELWGQPVVIENRAGAGGNVGAALVAKAAADGHTLLMTSGSIFTVNPHLYKKMPFDAKKDFVPVTNVASGPMVVAVPTALGIQTMGELIGRAKANPKALNFGSAGIGSQVHMAAENFAHAAGIEITHVPYKGEALAYTDLMAGQIQLVVGNIAAVSALLPEGRMKALAVTSRERSALLPQVPTASEAGLPGFENSGWFGFMAPAGTPREVVEKIQRDTARVLAQADVKQRLSVQGMTAVANTPADFAAAIEGESRRWAEVVAARKLSVE